MDVKLDPRIDVLVRVKVLWRVVHEISEKIGAPESFLELIRKGILEYKILSGIKFMLVLNDKECVATFILKIDWERHEVMANSTAGAQFKIERGKSVAEQVLSVATQLASYIDDIKRANRGAELRVRVWFRPEWTENREKYQQAQSLMGTVTDTMSYTMKRRSITISYIPESLPELNVDIVVAN